MATSESDKNIHLIDRGYFLLTYDQNRTIIIFNYSVVAKFWLTLGRLDKYLLSAPRFIVIFQFILYDTKFRVRVNSTFSVLRPLYFDLCTSNFCQI